MERIQSIGIEKEVNHDTINDALDVLKVIRNKLGPIFKPTI